MIRHDSSDNNDSGGRSNGCDSIDSSDKWLVELCKIIEKWWNGFKTWWLIFYPDISKQITYFKITHG